MDKFAGKTAVVTGAASGIGFGLALHASEIGMNVVIADINAAALANAEKRCLRTGARVLSVVVDVGDPESVRGLADASLDTFGEVNLLFNNAGIVIAEDIFSPAWDVPIGCWEKMISTNILGAVNGCLSFIPFMRVQDSASHIVNTASIFGLAPPGRMGFAVYAMTKYAIVGLTESLNKQLIAVEAPVNMSVLCPSSVSTAFASEAMAHRRDKTPQEMAVEVGIKQSLQSGMDPDKLAKHVFRAIKNGEFFIVPHAKTKAAVVNRNADIIAAYDGQHKKGD
jgi:NAD(P)-dependent dehydrogenase (short-subunit alcohol dehydrogenase family)